MAAFAQPWLDTRKFADEDADTWLEECRALSDLDQVDMGEASALVEAQHLAAQGNAALLLIDDPCGRQAAQAKLPSWVRRACWCCVGGYFLSDRLIEAVLAQTCE